MSTSTSLWSLLVATTHLKGCCLSMMWTVNLPGGSPRSVIALEGPKLSYSLPTWMCVVREFVVDCKKSIAGELLLETQREDGISSLQWIWGFHGTMEIMGFSSFLTQMSLENKGKVFPLLEHVCLCVQAEEYEHVSWWEDSWTVASHTMT